MNFPDGKYVWMVKIGEAKPHLRKNNRIKSIHSSLKIEANSLSLGQVRNVINGKTVLGEQKEIQEVMEKLGLKSKEGFRRNYLRPAVDMNLIRMTIPDKPNSRNQRYIKV